MSDNNKGNKDELTGPYSTLSVMERTKVLGLVPATSPGIIENTYTFYISLMLTFVWYRSVEYVACYFSLL